MKCRRGESAGAPPLHPRALGAPPQTPPLSLKESGKEVFCKNSVFAGAYTMRSDEDTAGASPRPTCGHSLLCEKRSFSPYKSFWGPRRLVLLASWALPKTTRGDFFQKVPLPGFGAEPQKPQAFKASLLRTVFRNTAYLERGMPYSRIRGHKCSACQEN